MIPIIHAQQPHTSPDTITLLDRGTFSAHHSALAAHTELVSPGSALWDGGRIEHRRGPGILLDFNSVNTTLFQQPCFGESHFLHPGGDQQLSLESQLYLSQPGALTQTLCVVFPDQSAGGGHQQRRDGISLKYLSCTRVGRSVHGDFDHADI